jgi:DNA gyrase subunit A
MVVSSLRVMGRATQGVKLINLKDSDSIAAVAKVVNNDEDVADLEEIEVTDKNSGVSKEVNNEDNKEENNEENNT